MNTRSIRFRLTVWYASLLFGLLLLFCAAVYLGLERYLRKTLEQSLENQAQQIGETFLVSVAVSGEEFVIEEINEHYAPELNNRFVRVTRADSSVMYASGQPEDQSFDPSKLTVLTPAEQGLATRVVRSPDGNELLIHFLPFVADNGSRFLIEVGTSYGQVEQTLSALSLILLFSLPIFVAAAIGGGYVVITRALTPLGEMTRGAERITSRNLNERLTVVGTGDEVERLSVSLNRMIARLEESFQHISRFSADASHELRTPLTVLRGELELLLQRRADAEETRETIASALEEVDRLTKIVESLLAISRLDAGEGRMDRGRVDMGELVATTADQMRLLAEDKNISLRFVAQEKAEVEGDRSRLKQVIVNLLDNAIKYTPENGTIQLKVSATNDSAVLEIEDNGAGIPAEALPHIFGRFYRVDKARSRQLGGTGLGLSIVKAICAAHGGKVEAQSKEGSGSCFRVELPLANETGNHG
jgi:heavy metal sensor kinase